MARISSQAQKLSDIPRFFNLHLVLVTNLRGICEGGSQIYLTPSPSKTLTSSGRPALHKPQAAPTDLQISQVMSRVVTALLCVHCLSAQIQQVRCIPATSGRLRTQWSWQVPGQQMPQSKNAVGKLQHRRFQIHGRFRVPKLQLTARSIRAVRSA